MKQQRACCNKRRIAGGALNDRDCGGACTRTQAAGSGGKVFVALQAV
jgi:hypothetical protein